MDLATITMPREEARRKFLEYRGEVKDRHNAEDAAIMAGYKALSQGKQLIQMSTTIQAAGLDDTGLPRFALARADGKETFYIHSPHTNWFQFSTDDPQTQAFSSGKAFRMPIWEERRSVPGADEAVNKIIPFTEGTRWGNREWVSMVPPVPPMYRPSSHLRNFHILWEAKWTKTARPRPPRDPALLKRIRGDLYAVLAVWDLTDLERAILTELR